MHSSLFPYLFDQLYEDKKALKIGYFYDNNFFPPVPSVSRALDMAIEELKKQGHEVNIKFCIAQTMNNPILRCASRSRFESVIKEDIISSN